MPNEEDVKNFISQWLKQFNVHVFWEKKNAWNYPVFKCSVKEKPDLLIEKQGIFWAIEVKNSSIGSKAIHDALVQTKRYANNTAMYSINEACFNIIPSGFLIASQNSIKGHLFDDEEIEPVSEGRAWAIRTGQLPKREYRETKNLIRIIWKLAKEDKIEIPVGALLSNILNQEFSIVPLLLYNKGKHGQSFEVWI